MAGKASIAVDFIAECAGARTTNTGQRCKPSVAIEGDNDGMSSDEEAAIRDRLEKLAAEGRWSSAKQLRGS